MRLFGLHVTDSILAAPAPARPSVSHLSPRLDFGRWLLPWMCPGLVLVAWDVVVRSGVVSRQLLVPPGQVVATFLHLLASGELGAHLAKSAMRLGLGFSIGAALGLAAGVSMAASKRVEEALFPVFSAIRQVPSIALVPALILLLGVEETFKIVIVAKSTFFPVALASYGGVKGIPRAYREVAAVYGLSGWALFRRLLFPATLPHIVAGVRTSLGRAWMILVACELIAAEQGLGQMMETGRQMFRIDVVMVGVLLTGAIGLALDRGVRLAQRALAPWSARV